MQAIKRLKNFAIFLAFLGAGGGILSSCQEEKKSGEIIITLDENTFFEGPIYLDELKVTEMQRLDSMMTVEDLKEGLHIQSTEPGLFVLKDIRGKAVLVYALPGHTVHIRFPDGDDGLARVEGPPATMALDAYFHRKAADERILDALGKEFRASRGLDDFPQIRERLDSAYFSLLQQHRDWVEAMILENDTSLFSIFLFNQRFGQQQLFDEEEDIALMARLAEKLSERYPGNVHAIDHKERLSVVEKRILEREQALQLVSPGRAFGEINLPDIQGNSFALSSLRGQKVLVHFWAATDARSRQENLKMKRFRDDFPGIALVSVSMDNNRQAWEAAAKLDGLEGINVSELLGSESPLAGKYLPEMELPVYYLLDESGTIQLRAFSLQAVEMFLGSKREDQ